MLPKALAFMLEHGKGQESRNGPVLRLTEPAALVYERPTERVIFHEDRDANPFFHLFEAIWMLAGRNDVAFPAKFVRRMASFSDDGITFNAAYGFRWRKHFGSDQVLKIIDALKADKDCRRQVLAIWDGRHDLGLRSKDLPCNTQCTFQIVDGRLDMVVSNRSNDLVWGATGANAVHFSFLQEFMAAAIGVPVGKYWQLSSNLHLYVAVHEKLMTTLADADANAGPYEDLEGIEDAIPVISTPLEQYLAELDMVLEYGTSVIGLKDRFLKRVVVPMMSAWSMYKQNDFPLAIAQCAEIRDPYWREACREWIERRRVARARAEYAADSGVIYE